MWLNHVNPFGTKIAKIVIFNGNKVNTIATDGLTLWITWLSAAVELNVQDKCGVIFFNECFKLAAPTLCWKITQIVNVYL